MTATFDDHALSEEGKLENMNEKLSAKSEDLVERLTCIIGV